MRRKYLVSLVVTCGLSFGLLAVVLGLGYSPRLGLDLQGGASVVLRPTEPASDDALDQSVEIIRQRVDGLGVAEPEIIRQGDTIVVNLPGVDDQARALQLIGDTAVLRFRPVLQFLGDQDLTQTTTTTPSETTGATTTPTETTAPTDTTAPADTTVPVTTVAEGADTSAAPAPGRSRALPRQTGTTAATTASAETTVPTETTVVPTETTVVPTETTVVPTPTTTPLNLAVNCFDAKDSDIPENAVILPQCTNDFEVSARYYLGPAFLDGSAVESAEARFSEQSGWTVNLVLRPGTNGIDTFNDWAQRCFNGEPECPGAERGRGSIAITLDGVVETAPAIQPDSASFSPFSRDQIVISGNFTEQEAKDLALVLRYGALPVELEREAVQTVSATLGSESLRAGVIAGIIGVVLVWLLFLLYYRSLSLVVFAGLAVSGAMLWTVVAWLGETQGLALTLAGATGIIVSIGVTVDSYVVYFERMKDDVQAGRSLRSAALKGYKQAWRTILAADIVSLIGAVILYYLTVGAVRGFAFFLGLSTIIDMIVSYFFTRPAVGLLSQTRWFAGKDKILGVESGEGLVPVGADR
jgi:preprotein translocase subunit SecD